MKLTTHLIYEAVLDDQLFAELPTMIAEATGARSCVLHWRDSATGAADIAAHSGYFSDEQMENYAANFVEYDLWTEAGMGQGRINKAWNTTDLVTQDEYDSSIFYNEWIRAMGDDTYYCCGSVMETFQGKGIIGLHRGRAQEDFSASSLNLLDGQVEHLRRMFGIRSRISHLTKRLDLLEAIFESGTGASLVIGSDGRVLAANPAGDSFLSSGRFLRVRNGRIEPSDAGQRETFERSLAMSFRPDQPGAAECILSDKDGALVIATFTPLTGQSWLQGSLVTINRTGQRVGRELTAHHLQSMYGLSAAEADVALRLTEGRSLRQISDERRSALGTVRTQMKHILTKLGVSRQADVVRTVLTLLK
ncbi:helix-turn-helix domain-containing protein [Sphingomonas sinipercae]|uniref:Helix-turn-helix domain-containing protein n=1 Tax=Sphingomonas sinipercae TaxID=2714944 RepID=A0A6G7ZLM4_9SPHN|nr:LuxR C-terminal-related transcriptional regulator [Sphingomonas sinipercae]QIL01819.1 helix-turn-helix domain-containing protein [Sphingomonas sinipercae]